MPLPVYLLYDFEREKNNKIWSKWSCTPCFYILYLFIVLHSYCLLDVHSLSCKAMIVKNYRTCKSRKQVRNNNFLLIISREIILIFRWKIFKKNFFYSKGSRSKKNTKRERKKRKILNSKKNETIKNWNWVLMVVTFIFFYSKNEHKITQEIWKVWGKPEKFLCEIPSQGLLFDKTKLFFFFSMVKIRKRYWIIKMRGWKKLRNKFAFLICIKKGEK